MTLPKFAIRSVQLLALAGLASAAVASGVEAGSDRMNAALVDQIQARMVDQPLPLDWKVGDRSSYNLKIGFVSGKSDQFVREDNGDTLWMEDDIDAGFLGKQKMEMLFDKATGKIKTLLVNGQNQTPPDTGDVEVIDTHPDHITVPAGEFDCTYAKNRNRKDGKIQEGWSNPASVPMGGMIRASGDTQFGAVTQELTAFSYAIQ